MQTHKVISTVLVSLLAGCLTKTVYPLEDKNCNTKYTAIVYSQTWCEPCHEAIKYLKEKKICVINKDVGNGNFDEKDEMRAKLRANNFPLIIYPTIDINGKILAGYSQSDVDQAISQAH